MKSTFDDPVNVILKNTQDLYLSDELPWVIGYSGGKDSTATLQLVWMAISKLPSEKRNKPIYVISTDTLVENPVVSIWVRNSLAAMRLAAAREEMPIDPHQLTPALRDRFWVNLIGKGYPAPRPKFRWCTSRLKISSSTRFITEVADRYGEAILVLGSRKAESAARDKVLQRYEKSTRELLSRNGDAGLDRVWIYTPVSSWSSDDVWEFLINYPNPWGYDNQELFNIYRGATPDAECPLVVDKSTPSCGDSRFGCFVCTMVSEDKSMQAMIQNDEEKRWMKPLLDFRNNYLKTEGDRAYREFTRMSGHLTLHDMEAGKSEPNEPSRDMVIDGKLRSVCLVHGPYTQDRRQEILQALLAAQEQVRSEAPKQVDNFELISIEELEEIRRIWVNEKHEFEDSLPDIYEQATGRPYPNPDLDEATPFRPADVRLLREVCEQQALECGSKGSQSPQFLHFRMLRDLLHVQHNYRSAIRRVGLIEDLEKAVESGSFESEEAALDFAIRSRDSNQGKDFFAKQESPLYVGELAAQEELEI
ncbi:MAG: DNA phosphorothioation system sulfurtransferase DndC [Burkholderiales bacterium]|nr:DNA phosphorothioation system sulfurtransferase DndC [Burkholderiales bacterium]